MVTLLHYALNCSSFQLLSQAVMKEVTDELLMTYGGGQMVPWHQLS